MSLLVTPAKANVQMNGKMTGGLDSMMDSGLRRDDDDETDTLRLGEGGGWKFQDEALTPSTVTIMTCSGQPIRTMS